MAWYMYVSVLLSSLACWSYDGDNVLDGMEYKYLSPRHIDTEGLINAPEYGRGGDSLFNCEELEGVTACESIYVTDPSLFDSDDDQLSDGQELRGWTVKIRYDKTKSDVAEYTVTSDPWSKDGDGDSLSDYDEFLNSSVPLSADTDGDHIPDKKEKQGKQPLIEGDEPELTSMGIEWSIRYNKWNVPVGLDLEFNLGFSDNAGLQRFYLWIAGLGSVEKTWDGVRTGHATFDMAISAGSVAALLKKIKDGENFAAIELSDINSNGFDAKFSAVSVLQKGAELALKAIQVFVEWVTDFISGIFNWIWELINDYLNIVLEPLKNAIKPWQVNFLKTLKFQFSEFIPMDIDPPFSVTEAVNAIFVSLILNAYLFFMLLVILLVIKGINIIIKSSTGNSEIFLEPIFENVKPYILKMILKFIAAGILSLSFSGISVFITKGAGAKALLMGILDTMPDIAWWTTGFILALLSVYFAAQPLVVNNKIMIILDGPTVVALIALIIQLITYFTPLNGVRFIVDIFALMVSILAFTAFDEPLYNPFRLVEKKSFSLLYMVEESIIYLSILYCWLSLGLDIAYFTQST